MSKFAPSQDSYKPALTPGWRLVDEIDMMGARYVRESDGLRVISAILRMSERLHWHHVSLCFGEGRMPSDEDVRTVRNTFIPADCRAIVGDPSGMAKANPWNVHLWASMPGKDHVPFGKLVPAATEN